jgi:predicted TIM-barrel fold metal-dependent hydrolase
MKAFDAYAHCGHHKYEPWPQVRDAHRDAGVTGGLLVQHLGEFDNTYLIDAARFLGSTYRVAVLVDPEQADWAAHIEVLAAQPEVVAVRVWVEGGTRWPAVAEAAAQNRLDILYGFPSGVTHFQDDIAGLAARLPRSRHVLTHLGGVRGVALEAPHVSALKRIAEFPNVVLMVSGLSMYWDYPFEGAGPIVPPLIQQFAPSRAVWGSNFPVRVSQAEYTRNLRFLAGDPWRLGVAGVARLLHDNAVDLWHAGSQHAA